MPLSWGVCSADWVTLTARAAPPSAQPPSLWWDRRVWLPEPGCRIPPTCRAVRDARHPERGGRPAVVRSASQAAASHPNHWCPPPGCRLRGRHPALGGMRQPGRHLPPNACRPAPDAPPHARRSGWGGHLVSGGIGEPGCRISPKSAGAGCRRSAGCWGGAGWVGAIWSRMGYGSLAAASHPNLPRALQARRPGWAGSPRSVGWPSALGGSRSRWGGRRSRVGLARQAAAFHLNPPVPAAGATPPAGIARQARLAPLP
jgi:hypothetical protein